MNDLKPQNITLLSSLFFFFLVLGGSAWACPASYIKAVAQNNQGTDLYDKSAEIADKYMKNRGMDLRSSVAEITRPYVIGTTLVENSYSKGPHSARNPKERIDLSADTVDEAVHKALGPYDGKSGESNAQTNGHGRTSCWEHFNRHFGNGIYNSNRMSGGSGNGNGQQTTTIENKPG
ncbi:MAG: hypothetical protein QF752_01255 [Planctomycetota bacterium]|jgi:hypothetical protein|nr:hypothetical protein [Planctomycetota bacterium]